MESVPILEDPYGTDTTEVLNKKLVNLESHKTNVITALRRPQLEEISRESRPIKVANIQAFVEGDDKYSTPVNRNNVNGLITSSIADQNRSLVNIQNRIETVQRIKADR